jgi:hypothetical protein
MLLLGPGLWVDADLAAELNFTLRPGESWPRAIRPEAVQLSPDATSPWTVQTGSGCGLYREATLTHTPSGKEIIVPETMHPANLPIAKNQPVTVLRLLGVFLALVLIGCDRASTEPELRVASWESFSLPEMGSSLPTPRSLACSDDNRLAILDTAGRVLIYSPQGALLKSWLMLDVSIGKPEGLVWMKDGSLMVCDTHYNRIVHFSSEGAHLGSFGKKGRGRAEFGYPVGITRDDRENLYVCEYGGNDRVQRFDKTGAFLGEFGSFGVGPGQFQRPSGLVWKAGKVYVADAINNRISIFTDSGTFIGNLGGAEAVALRLPYDICASEPVPTSNHPGFLVIEYGACRLTRLTPEGRLIGRYGSPGQNQGQFSTPWGACTDNAGTIYVADTQNRRIVKLRLR